MSKSAEATRKWRAKFSPEEREERRRIRRVGNLTKPQHEKIKRAARVAARTRRAKATSERREEINAARRVGRISSEQHERNLAAGRLRRALMSVSERRAHNVEMRLRRYNNAIVVNARVRARYSSDVRHQFYLRCKALPLLTKERVAEAYRKNYHRNGGHFRCYLCDVSLVGRRHCLEHKTPRFRAVKMGLDPHALKNLDVSCTQCNFSKNNMTVPEFIIYMGWDISLAVYRERMV